MYSSEIKKTTLSVAILVCVVAGLWLLVGSHAAAPFISVEPETGTITAPATRLSDTAASGGSYIAFGPTVTPTPNPSPASAVKLMPLGDSITNGYQMTPSLGGYRVLLWQKLVQQDHDNIDFVGSAQSGPPELGDLDEEGHNGYTVNDELARIDGWLATYKPDIILLHIGTNDVDITADGVSSAGRLDSLLSKIFSDEPNVKLVIAQIIARNSSDAARNTATDDYNRAIPGLASKYRAQGRAVQVVDMSTLLNPTSDYADYLHPDNQGYNKMAAAWYPAVSAAYKTF